jgi:hypothetical protein
MKKSIFFIFIALLAFESKAQQQDLFDRNWYATEIFVDGNLIPIPVLSVNSPQGCFVGIRIYSHNNNEGAIDISICWPCQAHIVSITNSSFVSLGFACLACDYCAPCHPNKPYSLCEGPDNNLINIQHIKNTFFAEYQGTYTYTITPVPDNHFQLKIDKANGDYIIYGTESTLSIHENETLTFSIVPNPTSNILTLTGLKSEVGSVVIYTLNGIKISLVSETNTYDVSKLAAGLYFISVTTVEGQKAVQKFVKK